VFKISVISAVFLFFKACNVNLSPLLQACSMVHLQKGFFWLTCWPC